MDAKYQKINSDIRKIRSMIERPWLPRVVLGMALLLVLLLHIPMTVMPLGRDQGIWVTAGMALAQGKVFYQDFLHFHFPGLAMAYQAALVFTDDPLVASIILNASASFLLVLGIYLLLRDTISPAAGAWGALLFAVQWPVGTGYWDIGQKDFMTAPGLLLAVWLVVRYGPGHRWRRWALFGSGMLVGCACMFKPLIGIAGLLIALGLVAQFSFSRRQTPSDSGTEPGWKSLLTDLLLLLAGGMLIGLAFILYLVIQGSLLDFWVSFFTVARNYGSQSNNSFAEMLLALYQYTIIVGEGNYSVGTLLLIVGAIAMVALPDRKKRSWLLVPFIAAGISFMIQRKGFPYHAMPWMVSLFLLAGAGMAWVWKDRTEDSTRPRGALFFVAALYMTLAVGLLFAQSFTSSLWARATVPTWFGSISRSEYLGENFSHGRDFPNPLVSETLADTIRRHTDPEDTILVWGLECQLYALSGRMYATNTPFDYLISSEAITQGASGWQAEKRQEFISMLQKQRPKYIIVVTRDNTLVEPMPSDEAIALIPGFQQFIDRNYHLEDTVERFKVYRLNP